MSYERPRRGYRWESRHGDWKRYNAEGRLTAFGDPNGVIGRILFRNGRPFCLSDRNNRPVLWLRHDQAGLLRTVYDRDGRGVTYRYREDRLSAVRDVMGKETRFAYDDAGRLAEVLGAEGKTNPHHLQRGRTRGLGPGRRGKRLHLLMGL